MAIIKHANPCGIAVGADVAEAHRKAHACDPVSAFGGVIAVNGAVTVAMAKQVADIFTEVVVAPAFDAGAVEVLAGKKNIRLLRAPAWRPPAAECGRSAAACWCRRPTGSTPRGRPGRRGGWSPATRRREEMLRDLSFAWRAIRSVKSNAILLARDGATVGVGMGQVNRVDSAHLAVSRAGADRARDAVAASDAFFPFADGLQVLADAGVRAIVQPGGSVRDEEVIAAAQAAGITHLLDRHPAFLPLIFDRQVRRPASSVTSGGVCPEPGRAAARDGLAEPHRPPGRGAGARRPR